MQIYYSPSPISGSLAGNYQYTDAAVNSAVNGLSGYSEIYRSNADVSGYPVTLLSYGWTNNGNAMTSYTIGIQTYQGIYLLMTATTSSYIVLDPDILTDFSNITIGEAEIVSYSDPELIKSVQELLNANGYACGAPDGIVGTGTQSAIQKYRIDQNLSDGTHIDAELLNALNSSGNAASSSSANEKIQIKFYSSVPKDVTGRWRLSTVNTDVPVENYLLNYYKNYFRSDDEIHAIINTYDNTTTCVSVLSGMFSVTVYKYVSGEENDAKILFSGDVISDEFYSMETGKIINF